MLWLIQNMNSFISTTLLHSRPDTHNINPANCVVIASVSNDEVEKINNLTSSTHRFISGLRPGPILDRLCKTDGDELTVRRALRIATIKKGFVDGRRGGDSGPG